MTPRIAIITGTFGSEVQNGVGVYYAGRHQYAAERRLPVQIFAGGKHVHRYPGFEEISALHFPVPGFQAIEAYYPLEGQRRTFRRRLHAKGRRSGP